MRFSPLGGLAALAGLSQAFLIPSTITAVDSKTVEAIPFEAQVGADADQLYINCPWCPIGVQTDGVARRGQSRLRLNLTIQHKVAYEGLYGTPIYDDALLMNDVQVFPVDPTAAWVDLHADQYIQGPDGKWVYVASPELSYSLRAGIHRDPKHQGVSAVAIRMRIRRVAKQWVRRVPSVDIKLIKTPNRKLMLANSHVRQAPTPDVVAVVSAPQCTNMMCRWRVTFMERVSSIRKGCGRKAGANRPPRPHGIFKTGPAGRPYPVVHENPHSHDHGPHAARPRHHGGFVRMLRNILFHAVVYVPIGLAIGIATSLVGAIVGHLIVFTWRALFRRGERGQCSRQAAEKVDEADVEDEKTAFLDVQEAPPIYEDAVADEKIEEK